MVKNTRRKFRNGSVWRVKKGKALEEEKVVVVEERRLRRTPRGE